MQNKTLGLIGAVLIIILAIVLGVWAYNSATPASTASLAAFRAEKPNLVVEGANLSKVEIWAVPTGTGVTEDQYQKLGDATLTNTGSTSTQRWIFQIPRDPISATDVLAKGFDAKGNTVGTLSLSINGGTTTAGATAIYNTLWGTSGQTAQNTIKIGGKITMGSITVTPIQVTEDSRCATQVQCIQAGRVVVQAKILDANGAEQIVNLSTDKTVAYKEYLISLVKVTPEATVGHRIQAQEYMLTISIAEDIKG